MESKLSGITKGLTVGAILVSAITTGFTGLATIVAQAIAILAFTSFLTLIVIHRREWFVWLREVRRQKKLLPLIGMIVFALGFVGCFAWWSLLSHAKPRQEKKMISVELADAQIDNSVGHALIQKKLEDAAFTEPVVAPTKQRALSSRATPTLQPEPTQIADNQATMNEFNRQRAQVLAIGRDWMSSNDGVPTTEAGILDKATPYINEQLKIRGENWQFDRAKRRALGFPPAVGDSYAN